MNNNYYLEYQGIIQKNYAEHASNAFFSEYRNDKSIKQFTYGQIIQEIFDFEKIINTYSLIKGGRVAIISGRNLSALKAFFSLTYHNISVLIIDDKMPVTEINRFLKETDIHAVFCDESFGNKINQEILIFDINDNYKLLRNADISRYKKLNIDLEVMLIILSSGTTSRTKAIELTYESVLKQVYGCGRKINKDELKDTLYVFPIYHLSGSMLAQYLFLNHRNIQLVETFVPSNLPKLFKVFNPTSFGMVPKVFEVLTNSLENEINSKKTLKIMYSILSKISYFNLRIFKSRKISRFIMSIFTNQLFGSRMLSFISGAAKANPDTVSMILVLGINWKQIYASTEMGAPITNTDFEPLGRIDSVGKVQDSEVEVIIHEPDVNGIGEIYLDSPYKMKGYYNDVNLSQSSFDGKYFKTGDYGYIDREGYLVITGRVKETILLHNGKKVSPIDLEEMNQKYFPDNEIAFVGIRNNEKGYDDICLCIKEITQDSAIRNNLKEIALSLNLEFPINEVRFISEIPKTAVGKVKRYLLNNKEATPEVKKEIPVFNGAIEEFYFEALNKYKVIEYDLDTLISKVIGNDSLRFYELFSYMEHSLGLKIIENMNGKETVDDILKLIKNSI